MFKSKSSILSVHYPDSIEATLGDKVEKYCKPDSFDIKVESGKHKFSIKSLRFSLPDIQDEEEIEERFTVENTYSQTIYANIPGVNKFSAANIAINGRPISDAGTILIDQDIIVLKRNIVIIAPKLKLDKAIDTKNIDEELEKDTNSVWANEAIDISHFFVRTDTDEIHVYDTFGNIKKDDKMVSGEEFHTHMKRINKLENVEYYKVFEDRYVRVEDVITEEQLQDSMKDPVLKEILEQPQDTENDSFKEAFEEVDPFEIKFINKKNPLFYDCQGKELDYVQPEVGARFLADGILHGVVDLYQIEPNKFVLATDVEKIEVKDPKPVVSKVEEPIVEDKDVDLEAQEEIIPEEVKIYDYDEEIAKTDAFAVKNAFEIDFREEVREINGIVEVKGDEDEKVNIYSSYKSNRELVEEKVVGGTFWYTNEAGNDEKGNRYFKIAVGTWISEDDVKYFDK